MLLAQRKSVAYNSNALTLNVVDSLAIHGHHWGGFSRVYWSRPSPCTEETLMDELFCLRCGKKEAILDGAELSPGWMLQFNGLICHSCDVETKDILVARGDYNRRNFTRPAD